jgi:ABC-type nitrate/sulfonate/bicarbonate transport system permease component
MQMKRGFWQTPVSGVVLVLLLAVAWEATVRLGVVRAEAWPALTDIGRVFGEPARSAELLEQIGGSLSRMLQGFLLGSLAGLAVGVLMGMSQRACSTLDLSLQLLRVIPIPALIPPAILFLGLDDGMKVTIVAFAASWPVMLNAFHAVRGIDETLIETARTFNTPVAGMLRSVVIPAAAPLIMAGLRLSLASALITTVVAEMIVGAGGVGAYIVLMEQAARIPEVYAAVIVLSVVGYVLNRVMIALERLWLPWCADPGRTARS